MAPGLLRKSFGPRRDEDERVGACFRAPPPTHHPGRALAAYAHNDFARHARASGRAGRRRRLRHVEREAASWSQMLGTTADGVRRGRGRWVPSGDTSAVVVGRAKRRTSRRAQVKERHFKRSWSRGAWQERVAFRKGSEQQNRFEGRASKCPVGRPRARTEARVRVREKGQRKAKEEAEAKREREGSITEDEKTCVGRQWGQTDRCVEVSSTGCDETEGIAVLRGSREAEVERAAAITSGRSEVTRA